MLASLCCATLAALTFAAPPMLRDDGRLKAPRLPAPLSCCCDVTALPFVVGGAPPLSRGSGGTPLVAQVAVIMTTQLAPSPLSDLLVVLGTQRFGADWPNVCAAVCAALGPLDQAPDPLDTAECEARYRQLVEGKPGELSALAARLQGERLAQLTKSRADVVARITQLCKDLPAGHPARPAAAFAAPRLDAFSSGGDGDAPPPKRARGGGSAAASNDVENELDENWHTIAEEEERNLRRATVAGTLSKMLNVLVKHKWAYPFKRPVTEKEAPDYKDVITNPMDFMTLKRRIEQGIVNDMEAFVADLSLIFDNAMKYNGEGTDFYKMAHTLQEIVKHQHALYTQWRAEHGGTLGAKSEAAPSAVDAAAPPEAAPAEAGNDGRRAGRRAGGRKS